MAESDSTPEVRPCKTCCGVVRYKNGKCKAARDALERLLDDES